MSSLTNSISFSFMYCIKSISFNFSTSLYFSLNRFIPSYLVPTSDEIISKHPPIILPFANTSLLSRVFQYTFSVRLYPSSPVLVSNEFSSYKS